MRFKTFLTLIGIGLSFVGAAGFFLPFILQTSFRNDRAIELPVVDVKDVAVAPNGDIYFALMHAARIQRYTGVGRFVSSFGVNSAGGIFCIDIVGRTLQVHVARRDATDWLDLDGKMLRENMLEDAGVNYLPCQRDVQVAELIGTWRSVEVQFTDGRPPITIMRRAWHRLAMGPFLSWLTFAVGLFLMAWWREGVLRMMGFGKKG